MSTIAENIQQVKLDKKQFETVFKLYYSNLCAYANNFLKDLVASEEVVQDVLFKLWVNRENIEITSSLQSYLFRSVRNSCLNVIKHVSVRENYKLQNERIIQMEERSDEDHLIVTELEQKIRETIDKLPFERRKVFIMSRYDGLKYTEIAEKLGISVKTVENQMGSALKFLRTELAEYLPWVILFFGNFIKR